jgi:SM-20-related protein
MLNPALDVRSLAEEFSRKNRIQIHDLLVPEAAEDLYRCLEDQVPWGLAYIDGEENKLLAADKLAYYTESDWAALDKRVQARGPDRFQFLYNSYMMITAYKERRDPSLILHRVVEWVNSPAYLQLLRAVTGVGNIMGADAQATRYMPGHFLRKHTDQVNNQYREVAYVMNLTKDWQADWGGTLQFVEEDGTVTETYLPTFNSREPGYACGYQGTLRHHRLGSEPSALRLTPLKEPAARATRWRLLAVSAHSRPTSLPLPHHSLPTQPDIPLPALPRRNRPCCSSTTW